MTHERLYENLSVAGLTGDLYELMKTIRPTISRNTIRLAFMRGGTTRLRRRIIEEAKKLYEEYRATEEGEHEHPDTTTTNRLLAVA